MSSRVAERNRYTIVSSKQCYKIATDLFLIGRKNRSVLLLVLIKKMYQEVIVA